MKEVAREKIAHLPTVIEELPRLSEALGGPRILVKRDDQTGLAFGGNKTRKHTAPQERLFTVTRRTWKLNRSV